MRKKAIDLVSTYSSSLIAIALPILAMPIYARHLTAKDWGIISLILLIQTIALLMEQGFSQCMVQEFVQAGRKSTDKQILLYQAIAPLYFRAGVLLATATAIAGTIYVLNSSTLQGNYSIHWWLPISAALLVAGQVQTAISRAYLIATEKHSTNAAIATFWQLARHSIGIAICIVYGNPAPLALWFAAVSVSEAFARRMHCNNLARIAAIDGDHQCDGTEYRNILKRGAKMSGAVIISASTVYIDRISVSQLLTLEHLGYYTLASTASLGTLQAIYPLGQVATPALIKSGAANSPKRKKILGALAALMFTIFIVCCLLYLTYGTTLLNMWLRNPTTEIAVKPILDILLIGTSLNAVYNIWYWNEVSLANHNNIFRSAAYALVTSAVFTPILVAIYGLKGASIGWALTNIILIVGACYLTIRAKNDQ